MRLLASAVVRLSLLALRLRCEVRGVVGLRLGRVQAWLLVHCSKLPSNFEPFIFDLSYPTPKDIQRRLAALGYVCSLSWNKSRNRELYGIYFQPEVVSQWMASLVEGSS